MTPEEQHAARRVGTVLGGRWTLERVIGVGGMAAVYAARAPDGSLAALKLLHPEMGLRSEVRQRFLREGMAANKVGHPGAVRVLDHATSEGEDTFLVMELLEGESLAERRAREPLTPDELLDLLDQTLDVLAAAHACGIVHRDLKLDNLFLTRDGRVKVLDFGLARFLDSVPGDLKTRTGIAMGTLPYMAPEQALGKRDQIDGRTDLFALGAVAYRILTGRRIHEADSEAGLLLAMATQPAPPVATVAPEVPAWIGAIVDLALAFARDARYPDARTMQSDVRAVRAGSPPPHATRVTSARDEATRAERPAPPAALAVTTAREQATRAERPAPSAVSAAPILPTAQELAKPPPGYAPLRPQHRAPDRRLLSAGAALALLLVAALLVGAGVIASRTFAERVEPAQISDKPAREAEKRAQEKRREAEKREEKAKRKR
jgi:eukaryotic-like serine/threonine-protein kinase